MMCCTKSNFISGALSHKLGTWECSFGVLHEFERLVRSTFSILGRG
jgi:hypothetical protein